MTLHHCESLTVKGSVSSAVTGAKQSLTFGDQKEKKKRADFLKAVCVLHLSFT
jgi:hypothetical protein